MEHLHQSRSSASKNTVILNTNLCVHKCLQHDPSSAPDALGSTRPVHENTESQVIPNRARIPSISISSLTLIILVPLYETGFVPINRRLTSTVSGISPLNQIGIGLHSLSRDGEKKRKNLAGSFSWTEINILITPQFLIFGMSEMFTALGLIEFFYKQSLGGMQSFLTAMTYCSYSFGFFLSSLLVSLVNNVTSSDDSKSGWLSDNDLNKDRLDLFYWMLAGLGLLNFFNHLFWSRWYSYKPASTVISVLRKSMRILKTWYLYKKKG